MAGSGGGDGEAWLKVVLTVHPLILAYSDPLYRFALLQQTKPHCWTLLARFSKPSRQASSRANSLAFFQSENTFMTHCVDCWVFPGTNPFCRSYSASLLTNWKWSMHDVLETLLSARLNHFFLYEKKGKKREELRRKESGEGDGVDGWEGERMTGYGGD